MPGSLRAGAGLGAGFAQTPSDPSRRASPGPHVAYTVENSDGGRQPRLHRRADSCRQRASTSARRRASPNSTRRARSWRQPERSITSAIGSRHPKTAKGTTRRIEVAEVAPDLSHPVSGSARHAMPSFGPGSSRKIRCLETRSRPPSRWWIATSRGFPNFWRRRVITSRSPAS